METSRLSSLLLLVLIALVNSAASIPRGYCPVSNEPPRPQSDLRTCWEYRDSSCCNEELAKKTVGRYIEAYVNRTFSRCPQCQENFRLVHCAYHCSPNASSFVFATKTRVDGTPLEHRFNVLNETCTAWAASCRSAYDSPLDPAVSDAAWCRSQRDTTGNSAGRVPFTIEILNSVSGRRKSYSSARVASSCAVSPTLGTTTSIAFGASSASDGGPSSNQTPPKAKGTKKQLWAPTTTPKCRTPGEPVPNDDDDAPPPPPEAPPPPSGEGIDYPIAQGWMKKGPNDFPPDSAVQRKQRPRPPKMDAAAAATSAARESLPRCPPPAGSVDERMLEPPPPPPPTVWAPRPDAPAPPPPSTDPANGWDLAPLLKQLSIPLPPPTLPQLPSLSTGAEGQGESESEAAGEGAVPTAVAPTLPNSSGGPTQGACDSPALGKGTRLGCPPPAPTPPTPQLAPREPTVTKVFGTIPSPPRAPNLSPLPLPSAAPTTKFASLSSGTEAEAENTELNDQNQHELSGVDDNDGAGDGAAAEAEAAERTLAQRRRIFAALHEGDPLAGVSTKSVVREAPHHPPLRTPPPAFG
eukprot:gnl/Spiro4/13712_TR7307_c0_g1_i1.p1 gnl/Spiro4/13712_TR7307_c0_g1~~gnl/Spiro4/13712_TR7307_c0_g1_i1.p1  ORF type:complete len:579 (+),score=100.02 gnl/Spiro4/13712_TR7307_c0_g1_i1:46-1782(+)